MGSVADSQLKIIEEAVLRIAVFVYRIDDCVLKIPLDKSRDFGYVKVRDSRPCPGRSPSMPLAS
jgi:hypothetical protein